MTTPDTTRNRQEASMTDQTARPATSAGPGELLGGMRGPLPEAFAFAAEIAAEWQQRVVLRVDKRREDLPPTVRPHADGPTWDVFAQIGADR